MYWSVGLPVLAEPGVLRQRGAVDRVVHRPAQARVRERAAVGVEDVGVHRRHGLREELLTAGAGRLAAGAVARREPPRDLGGHRRSPQPGWSVDVVGASGLDRLDAALGGDAELDTGSPPAPAVAHLRNWGCGAARGSAAGDVRVDVVGAGRGHGIDALGLDAACPAGPRRSTAAASRAGRFGTGRVSRMTRCPSRALTPSRVLRAAGQVVVGADDVADDVARAYRPRIAGLRTRSSARSKAVGGHGLVRGRREAEPRPNPEAVGPAVDPRRAAPPPPPRAPAASPRGRGGRGSCRGSRRSRRRAGGRRGTMRRIGRPGSRGHHHPRDVLAGREPRGRRGPPRSPGR